MRLKFQKIKKEITVTEIAIITNISINDYKTKIFPQKVAKKR